MRKTLLFLTLIMLCFPSIYAQISKNELLDLSKTIIEQQNLDTNISTIPKYVTELKTNDSIYAYVVNLEPKGFIVFSPSKKLTPIICFSTESNFNYSKSKDNTLLYLIETDMKSNLKAITKNLNKKAKQILIKNTNSWERLKTTKFIQNKTTSLIQYGPLFTSVWGGVNCYDNNGNLINVGNYYTPNNYSPGCVATTLAMILHYYNWPKTGVGTHTNYDTSGSSQTSWTANFGGATYDYDNMLDEYMDKPSTLIEQQAMGYISFHAATALDMDYESSGSTSNINRIPSAGSSYFRFSGHHQYSSWANFWSRMHENIENGHPVPIAIDAINGSGHAPAVDGYRYNMGDPETEYYYHLNMGWYGTNNAWYRLQNSFNAGGYTSISAAVFDLLPVPAFTENEIITTNKTFNLNWETSDNLNWEAFELQESTDGGTTYITIDNALTTTNYTRTVTSGGSYKYRVRSKSDGAYYANSYSKTIDVKVPYDFTYLDFDGNDSFFIYDNTNNDFDISNTYTIETWINIDSRTTDTYPIILDRRTVFSLFLIADASSDYAVKFAVRDSSGNISSSLQSDSSSEDLNFGEWVHVAVTRDGTNTRLFINGKLVGTSTDADFSLSPSTYPLNIGARYWGAYERYLDGKIDKIRILDSAIYTANFIPDLKEKYITSNNTRILLSLDEGTGTNLIDAANNFNMVQLRDSPNQANWMFDDEVPIVRTLGVDEKKLKLTNNKINVYPNPAIGSITNTITTNNSSQTGKIVIYNLLGQVKLLKDVILKYGTNSINIDISNLKTGQYIYTFKTKGKIYNTKFIKN